MKIELLSKISKWADTTPPLFLAIVIDLIKLIPYVDFIASVPLEWKLWSRLDSEMLKYVNIAYDLGGDIVLPVVGDLFPLNTALVIGYMVRKSPKLSR